MIFVNIYIKIKCYYVSLSIGGVWGYLGELDPPKMRQYCIKTERFVKNSYMKNKLATQKLIF